MLFLSEKIPQHQITRKLSLMQHQELGSRLRICCDVNTFFLKRKINTANLQESTADITQCCHRNHRNIPKQNISMKSEAQHRVPHYACKRIRQSPEKSSEV